MQTQAAGTAVLSYTKCVGNSVVPTGDHGQMRVPEIADCPFCRVAVTTSKSAFDTRIASGPGVYVMPALGMLVPGYLLLVTEDHYLSMAGLGTEALAKVATWLDEILSELTPVFGSYLLFEHGSCAAELSGACIDHAHIHMIPVATELEATVAGAGAWEPCGSLVDLAGLEDVSYAYYSTATSNGVISRPQLGSQWIRRVVAAHFGTDLWDWALEPNEANLKETLARVPHFH